jgi:hypothetical protein
MGGLAETQIAAATEASIELKCGAF